MRGPARRRALLALALVALLALAAPLAARAADDDEDSSSSSSSSQAAAAQADADADSPPPPPPPPPPPKRAPARKLAFEGEAVAYAGTADDAVPSSGASKASAGNLLLTGNAASVAAGAALSIAFQTTLGGKPATPQQAVLRLSPATGAPFAYVWARRRKGGAAGDLVVTVTHSEVERQIGRVPPPGALAAALLIGDPSATDPHPQGVEWPLGDVRFAEAVAAATGPGGAAAGNKANNNKPAKQPKLLTAAHQPAHNALPDIRHAFRRPERRAPAVVSLVFTALALLPLAALVPALLAAGANLKGWPSDPSAATWSTAFLASLAAFLALLVVFWLRLTLASALWPAVVLGSALWFSGWKALRAQATARVAAAGGGAAAGGKKAD